MQYPLKFGIALPSVRVRQAGLQLEAFVPDFEDGTITAQLLSTYHPCEDAPVGERMLPKTSGVDREIDQYVGKVCTLGMHVYCTSVYASQIASERHGNENAIMPDCLGVCRTYAVVN